MANNTIIYSTLLFVASTFIASAQRIGNMRFDNVTDQSALSNINIKAITQDRDGFLWLGTTNGLCRYDPNEKVSVYVKGEKTSLRSNSIRSLHCDRAGNLWIGTFSGGLTRYNQRRSSWKTYFPNSNNPNSLSNEDVLSIHEDRQGYIWVGTEYGLNVFDPKTEQFTTFLPEKDNDQAIQVKAIISILEDHAGRIWLGTWSGGIYLALPHPSGEISKMTFRRFDPSTQKRSHNVWKLFQDQQNRLWVGTFGEGIFLMQLPIDASNQPDYQRWQPSFYQYKRDEDNPHSIQSNRIFDFNQDLDGRLWIATHNGLAHINPQDLPDYQSYNRMTQKRPELKFHFHRNHMEMSHSIINNVVSNIYVDDDNITWFGTLEGLSRYNPNPIMFDYYNFSDVMTESFNGQNVYISADQKAWIANGEKGLFIHDLVQDKNVELPKALAQNTEWINGIYQKNSQLYLGTSTGFQKYNLSTGDLDQFIMPDSLSQNIGGFTIKRILVDQQEEVWMSTDNGIIHFNPTTSSFQLFKTDIDNKHAISDNSITGVLQDSRGNLWISTYNGLNLARSDQQGGYHFQHFKSDPENPTISLISNQVLSMEETADHLYLGTLAGLCRYDYERNVFERVTEIKEQFHIFSLTHVDDVLWASSTRGIIKFDLLTGNYFIYDRENGIWDLDFNYGAYYVAEDGHLYFGSGDGLLKFHPSKIKTQSQPPTVVITELEFKNDRQDSILHTLGLTAPQLLIPNEFNQIFFNFTALTFDRNHKHKFAYRLKGFEEKWHTAEADKRVHYTNLSKGEYTFQVKGASQDGVWASKSTDLTITVEGGFYETPLFLFLLLSLGGAFLYGCAKLYNRALLYRNQQMEKIVKKRTSELANKNEEVKRLLKRVSVQNEALEATVAQRTKKLKEANEELLRSNQDLEQFAYIASHDLQEPLRTVGSFVNLLGRRYSSSLDENAKQYIEFAVDGVTRMSKLITSTLVYSKVGRKELQFSPSDIPAIIETKLRDLQQKISENKVEVEINLADLPAVCCEHNQIGMVFYNLINNGIKFNKAVFPKITIDFHPDYQAGFWTFSVADNGIGIQEEYQGKIFEIFRRLHGKTEYEGSGIGLALCKKIIFRHKGEIWVDSTHGQGSKFYFTIAKDLQVQAEEEPSDETEEQILLQA